MAAQSPYVSQSRLMLKKAGRRAGEVAEKYRLELLEEKGSTSGITDEHRYLAELMTWVEFFPEEPFPGVAPRTPSDTTSPEPKSCPTPKSDPTLSTEAKRSQGAIPHSSSDDITANKLSTILKFEVTSAHEAKKILKATAPNPLAHTPITESTETSKVDPALRNKTNQSRKSPARDKLAKIPVLNSKTTPDIVTKLSNNAKEIPASFPTNRLIIKPHTTPMPEPPSSNNREDRKKAIASFSLDTTAATSLPKRSARIQSHTQANNQNQTEDRRYLAEAFSPNVDSTIPDILFSNSANYYRSQLELNKCNGMPFFAALITDMDIKIIFHCFVGKGGARIQDFKRHINRQWPDIRIRISDAEGIVFLELRRAVEERLQVDYYYELLRLHRLMLVWADERPLRCIDDFIKVYETGYFGNPDLTSGDYTITEIPSGIENRTSFGALAPSTSRTLSSKRGYNDKSSPSEKVRRRLNTARSGIDLLGHDTQERRHDDSIKRGDEDRQRLRSRSRDRKRSLMSSEERTRRDKDRGGSNGSRRGVHETGSRSQHTREYEESRRFNSDLDKPSLDQTTSRLDYNEGARGIQYDHKEKKIKKESPRKRESDMNGGDRQKRRKVE